MKELIVIYLFLINIFGFIIMKVDKQKAINHKWRISEKLLILIAIFGGSIGILVGMRIWRHKTKHPLFYIGVPVILLIQILIDFYVVH